MRFARFVELSQLFILNRWIDMFHELISFDIRILRTGWKLYIFGCQRRLHIPNRWFLLSQIQSCFRNMRVCFGSIDRVTLELILKWWPLVSKAPLLYRRFRTWRTLWLLWYSWFFKELVVNSWKSHILSWTKTCPFEYCDWVIPRGSVVFYEVVLCCNLLLPLKLCGLWLCQLSVYKLVLVCGWWGLLVDFIW